MKLTHQLFPMIDRTQFFACLSFGMVLLALVVFYKGFRIKSLNGFRVCIKIMLCLFALAVIFFVSFSVKEIDVVCTACNTTYSYQETRIFGKLISGDNFRTSFHPDDLLSKRIKDFRCFHSFRDQQRMKYWGGRNHSHFGILSRRTDYYR